MPKNMFLSALEKSNASTQCTVVLSVLKEFCAAIQEYSEDKIKCDFDPDFKIYETNYHIRLSNKSLDYRLLTIVCDNRNGVFYIDAYDDSNRKTKCVGEKALRKGLITFLTNSNIRDIIKKFNA